MENYLLIVGVLLNSALIIINRFVYRLPNWIQIPLCLLGIGLIVAGMVMMRK
jgi:hypothetical protein